MSLDENIKNIVNQNLNNTLDVYEEVNGNPNGLQTWILQYAGIEIENNYSFIHGHILGDLQGQAHASARTLLGRALTADERNDLVNITKSKRNRVIQLVDALKKV